MKNLLKKSSSLFTLLLLGSLVIFFAFSIKQGVFTQSVAGQPQDNAYPVPSNIVTPIVKTTKWKFLRLLTKHNNIE